MQATSAGIEVQDLSDVRQRGRLVGLGRGGGLSPPTRQAETSAWKQAVTAAFQAASDGEDPGQHEEIKAANDGEDPGQHVGVLARTPGSTRRTLAVVRCIAGTVKAQLVSQGLMITFIGYDPDKTRVTVRRATEGGMARPRHPLWLALGSVRGALQPGEATRENSSGLSHAAFRLPRKPCTKGVS